MNDLRVLYVAKMPSGVNISVVRAHRNGLAVQVVPLARNSGHCQAGDIYQMASNRFSRVLEMEVPADHTLEGIFRRLIGQMACENLTWGEERRCSSPANLSSRSRFDLSRVKSLPITIKHLLILL